MPFKSRPEDFGQRILGRVRCRYMRTEEFDALIDNPKPLSETFGPDEEIMYIEITDARKPEAAPKRTFLRAEYSPVSKWVRWVTSWREAGREFNADDPSSHDGEWAWIDIKSQLMGKYGRHDVWLYGGVPTPEEIAAMHPASVASEVSATSTHTGPIFDPADVDTAVALIPYGTPWAEAQKIVADFLGTPVAPADIIAAFARVGGYKVLAGIVAQA